MRIIVRTRRRVVYDSDSFFDVEDGVVDETNGDLLCPVCRCCSLQRIPRFVPSLFTQAEFYAKGEVPNDEDMGWVCASGCSKTQRHE